MITEVCGYKDSTGKFHSTKVEAIISDIAFSAWQKGYKGSIYGPTTRVSEYEDLLRAMLNPEYKEMLTELVTSIPEKDTCKPC